jgi:hypothetical protein
MLVVLSLFIFSFSPAVAQTTAPASSDSTTEKELVRIAQALLDATAVGDKAVWEKYLAEDHIYTDENWRVLTKRELIESLAPLPPGFSGSIRVANVQSRIHGDCAVLSYRALEEEHIFGQTISPTYLITDTYCKHNGQWQLLASHVIVHPSERKPMAINPKNYKAFVGKYQLTPGVAYTITLEDNKLMGQRTDREKEELLPADENTFYPKDSLRSEKVFVRDATGRVTHFLDRRENNDLVWKKVK